MKRHVDAAVADLGRVRHDRQTGLFAHGPEGLEHRRARVGDDGLPAPDELGRLDRDASLGLDVVTLPLKKVDAAPVDALIPDGAR